MQVFCTQCKGIRNHSVAAGPVVVTSDPDYGFDSEDNFYIVQCDGCDEITFLKTSWDEEMDPDADPKQTIYSETVIEELENLRDFKKFESVPEFIIELYKEAMIAFNRDLLVLASVGQRGLIEAICKDKGIDANTIQNKIDKLVEENYITPINGRVLHQIRRMGNAATHQSKKHDKKIIAAAMEVIETMLYSIYELETLELYPTN